MERQTTPEVPLNSLARRLREETQQAHTQAETSSFMVDLMNGDLGVEAFLALQEQALIFYSAIERAVDALSSDPRVAKIADRRLDRTDALRNDVAQLGGNASPESWQPLPATQAYVAELDNIVAEGDAAGIIAHHYVRYLGDLSGGQIIATKMRRLLDVQPEALTFYDFSGIGKLKPYKDSYRETLDQLQDFLTPDEREHLIDMASSAFTHNQQVFRDLGEQFPTPEAQGPAGAADGAHAG